jgi:hypothetical protein
MLSELLPEEKRRLHELELQLEDVAAGRRNPADVRLGVCIIAARDVNACATVVDSFDM